MAEIDLLVRGVDTDYGQGADGNANVANQKGDMVSYTTMTSSLTGSQVPPAWCVIRVTDLSDAQASEYVQSWRQALAFEWISKQPTQDSWHLKIRSSRYRMSDGFVLLDDR